MFYTKPYTADDFWIEIIKRIETKPTLQYSAQRSIPTASRRSEVMEHKIWGKQAEVSYSHSQFKNAMSQFANEQESRGRGSYQDSFSIRRLYALALIREVLEVIYNQEQQYAPQFINSSMGQDSKAKEEALTSFPQQPGSNDGRWPWSSRNGRREGFPHHRCLNSIWVCREDSQAWVCQTDSKAVLRHIKQTIIAVNCPKGGCWQNKTISKELAIAYANVKIGGQPQKVCLVDCDLRFSGDVSSMLNLQPLSPISYTGLPI